MAISLKSVTKEIVPVPPILLDEMGSLDKVSYRPSRFTPKLTAAMREADAKGEPDAGFIEMFCSVVASWDVLGDDGKPVPIDASHLADVPWILLRRVVEAVTEHMNPPARSKSSSFDA